MLGAEWNAMQEGTAGRLQFYAEVAAEALRRYPDVPPAPKVGGFESMLEAQIDRNQAREPKAGEEDGREPKRK
jgi:hypothetical protein